MSLYADYIKEKTSDNIIENGGGFATYRYLDQGKTVYIIDIFVPKTVRRNHNASLMADEIVKEAKSKGCTKLIGSIIPSNKNSTMSLRVLLGYGMNLESATNDFIIFRKDI